MSNALMRDYCTTAADTLKRCTSLPGTLLRVMSYVFRDMSHC